MVQMFILTRAFAVSALFVGAFPVTYAAPVPNVVVHEARHYPRGCRLMGCLYALPTGQDATTAANTTGSTSSQSALSSDSLQIIEFLISALTTAKDSVVSASSAVANAITVDAVNPVEESSAPVVDAATSFAEELAASLESDAEALSAPIAATTVPAVEVTPVQSEATSLDALV